jgi:hypothetical protein
MDTNEKEIYERLATLETLAEAGKQERAEIKEEMHSVRTTVEAMDKKLSRYEGKLGGIFIVVAAIGALLKWLWVDIRAYLGRGE